MKFMYLFYELKVKLDTNIPRSMRSCFPFSNDGPSRYLDIRLHPRARHSTAVDIRNIHVHARRHNPSVFQHVRTCNVRTDPREQDRIKKFFHRLFSFRDSRKHRIHYNNFQPKHTGDRRKRCCVWHYGDSCCFDASRDSLVWRVRSDADGVCCRFLDTVGILRFVRSERNSARCSPLRFVHRAGLWLPSQKTRA